MLFWDASSSSLEITTYGPGAHNSLVTLYGLLLMTWGIFLLVRLYRMYLVYRKVNTQEILFLDGLGSYADDFQKLFRTHFNQILRLRRTVLPVTVPAVSVRAAMVPTSLQFHFGDASDYENRKVGLSFSFTAVSDCSVSVYWGVNALKLNGFMDEMSDRYEDDGGNGNNPMDYSAGHGANNISSNSRRRGTSQQMQQHRRRSSTSLFFSSSRSTNNPSPTGTDLTSIRVVDSSCSRALTQSARRLWQRSRGVGDSGIVVQQPSDTTELLLLGVDGGGFNNVASSSDAMLGDEDDITAQRRCLAASSSRNNVIRNVNENGVATPASAALLELHSFLKTNCVCQSIETPFTFQEDRDTSSHEQRKREFRLESQDGCLLSILRAINSIKTTSRTAEATGSSSSNIATAVALQSSPVASPTLSTAAASTLQQQENTTTAIALDPEDVTVPLVIVISSSERSSSRTSSGIMVRDDGVWSVDAYAQLSIVRLRVGGDRTAPYVPEAARQIVLLPQHVAPAGVIGRAQEIQEIFGLEERNERECLICMACPKDAMLLPCRHCTLCYGCLRSLRQERCPICRCAFSSFIIFPMKKDESCSSARRAESSGPNPTNDDNEDDTDDGVNHHNKAHHHQQANNSSSHATASIGGNDRQWFPLNNDNNSTPLLRGEESEETVLDRFRSWVTTGVNSNNNSQSHVLKLLTVNNNQLSPADPERCKPMIDVTRT